MSSFIPSRHSVNSDSSVMGPQGDEEIAIMNDHQLKYVNALTKQLKQASSTNDDSIGISGSVILQPPKNSKHAVARQGPFLLQPAPPDLEGSLEDPEATDLVYIEVGLEGRHRKADDDGEGEGNEKLGVMAVVYKDGKVDLCLDTEKVEGRWEVNSPKSVDLDLPSFTVYESVDLGLISALHANSPESPSSLLPLLEANYPTFQVDPLYPGRIYVAHAFGVHAIDTIEWMKTLFSAMQDEVTANVTEGTKAANGSEVIHLLDTFSPETRFVISLIDSERNRADLPDMGN